MIESYSINYIKNMKKQKKNVTELFWFAKGNGRKLANFALLAL
jgi:hypothetical protein